MQFDTGIKAIQPKTDRLMGTLFDSRLAKALQYLHRTSQIFKEVTHSETIGEILQKSIGTSLSTVNLR
jgi:hypothetical protein